MMTKQSMAFILRDSIVALDGAAIVKAIRARHPDLPVELAGGPAPTDAAGPAMIKCGNNLFAVMSIQAPLPQDDDLWKRAQLVWPEARDVAARHRAHLIVAPFGAEGEKLPVAREITAVVGGLIAATPGCSAVAWKSHAARSAGVWLDMSRGAFAPSPPFMLWVDIVPFKTASGFGAVIVGLSTFVDREIEFEVEGMDWPVVVQRVSGLVSYLIEHGHVIKDGDTIGVSESERIVVRYATSRFHGWPVFAIGSQRKAPGTRKSFPIIPATIARDRPLLIMLRKVDLFDGAAPENQVELLTDAYISEVRLESYDRGTQGFLSGILQTDAYVEADQEVRRALASGDLGTAKAILAPFREEVRKFLAAARYALGRGDLFMFQPK